jgi:YjbE family integral membrane protein
MDLTAAVFWIALAKIIGVNIVLSGDNAVVIAMAARNLPQRQQKMAIVGGSAAAIVLRVILTMFAVAVLEYPYLKLVGSLILLWIGIQLLADNGDEVHVHGGDSIWVAIRTILIADLVMSLDNVIAVAASADTAPHEARLLLLILGLGTSIPLIIFGSTLLLKLMQRFPVIVTLGGALLGFVAGEMAVTDLSVQEWFDTHMHGLDYVVSIACAVFVVMAGSVMARRKQATT